MQTLSNPHYEDQSAVSMPSHSSKFSDSQEYEDTIQIVKSLVSGDYQVDSTHTSELGIALKELIDKLSGNATNDLNRIVDLSISNNEASISSAQLLYDLQKVENYAQRIAAAAEEMCSSVQEVKQYSDSIDQGTTNSLKMAEDVSNTLQKAVKAFEDMYHAVAENSQKLSGLSNFTKQVRDIAEQIKGIAFQSNILSMNAAVEAARAGSHGLGFGVIAQEIHLLSGRSENATAQITQLVNAYEKEVTDINASLSTSQNIVNEGQSSINLVSESMTTMVSEFEQVSNNTTQITQTLHEQAKASAEVSAGINTVAAHSSKSVHSADSIVEAIDDIQSLIDKEITTVAELNIPGKIIKLAQSDHVIWKKRLVNMIAGKEGLQSSELADHHGCRLGKWYDKVNQPQLRNHPAFLKLRHPHELVHKHGKKAVDLYNSGQVGAALNEIKHVETASADVLSLLRMLESA